MIIASTNIFAYDDNMQSLPRMKYDELHRVRQNNDNVWMWECLNACDGASCGRISSGGTV